MGGGGGTRERLWKTDAAFLLLVTLLVLLTGLEDFSRWRRRFREPMVGRDSDAAKTASESERVEAEPLAKSAFGCCDDDAEHRDDEAGSMA